MKKIILTLVVCVLSTQFFYAQLKVSADGNVGIQMGTNTPLSALSVGGVGDVNTKLFIEALNSNNGLFINRTGTTSYSLLIGLSSFRITSYNVCYTKLLRVCIETGVRTGVSHTHNKVIGVVVRFESGRYNV